MVESTSLLVVVTYLTWDPIYLRPSDTPSLVVFVLTFSFVH